MRFVHALYVDANHASHGFSSVSRSEIFQVPNSLRLATKCPAAERGDGVFDDFLIFGMLTTSALTLHAMPCLGVFLRHCIAASLALT